MRTQPARRLHGMMGTQGYCRDQPMPANSSFAIRVYNCTVLLVTPDSNVSSVLERLILPTLPRIETAGIRADISIRVAQSGAQLELFIDDFLVKAAAAVEELVVALIKVLDDAIVARLDPLRAIHSGAVGWGGRVILLPGSTHSGKSSLVAELLRRGAVYFSDEYSLIDDQGFVHPYPRPLLLRNGQPRQVPVLASELSAAVADTSAPVGWIFALRYEPQSAWNVERMAQGEAVLTLLRNTPHFLSESPEMVAAFAKAVAGASFYAGQRPDVVEAADHILQMIDGPV